MGKFSVVVSERSDRMQPEQSLSCTIVDSIPAPTAVTSCTIVDSAPGAPVAAMSCAPVAPVAATSCTINEPAAMSCTLTTTASAGDRELAPLVA